MMETRIQRFIFETPNGRVLGRALKVDGGSLMSMRIAQLDDGATIKQAKDALLKVDGGSLMSMRIAQLDEHAAVHDYEDVDLVALDLVDDTVGIAPHLTEAAGVLRAVECRLSPGLRPVNTERAETRRHGEGGRLDVEFTGQEGKRAISGFSFDRRCFAYADLARTDGTVMPGMPDYAIIGPCQGMGEMSVAPLGDRKRRNRCVCQPRNSPPCLRVSARSVLTDRRPFEGRAK